MEKSDNLKDYQKEVDDSLWESFKEVVSDGMDFTKETFLNRIDDARKVAKALKETVGAAGSLIVEGAKTFMRWLF